MRKLILKTIFLSIISQPLLAYLGPGVGGGIIAATIGVVIAVFAAIVGLVWFPIKKLIKKKNEKKENDLNKSD